jgi:hypothetical protein
MSCRNYETILTEVARGQMLDARARTDALAHAEACARCAARLADERALSAGLRALASSAAAAQTPLRLEEALVTAFRHRSTFVPAGAPAAAAKPRRAWWAVAAAAVLVVSTLVTLRLLPAGAEKPVEQGARAVQPSPRAVPPWREDGRTVEGPGRSVASGVDDRDRKSVAGVQPQRARRDVRRGLVHDAAFGGGRTGAGVNPEVAATADEEIATDFMPLSYDGRFSQIDGGQVVRVELPRSALHSFGLPVNAERAGERVKADVLLGHDGVARAIRFVR